MIKEHEFIDLINPYQATIYKICRMYANNKEELSDLFQESLMNMWEAYPKFRGDCKISTWIYRISLNTCISDLKKRKKMEFVELHSELQVYEECERVEQLKELYTLIKQLNKIERALILLWLEEKSYDEIASIMQLSKSNVSVKLCRIKEKLKKL